MKSYDAKNWFWIVGGDESKAWSSAEKTYVTDFDAEMTSRIANEIELFDVLAKTGQRSRAPSRTFSVAEIRDALIRIDAAATGDANDAAALQSVAEDVGITLPAMA
jgi:hypothetical protein